MSWTVSQASTMAQVIPVIALALGLEMREVRKFFDDQIPEVPSGRHVIKPQDEEKHDTSEGGDEEQGGKELQIKQFSRYTIIGLLGCLAMLALLVGEQTSIAVVLGKAYNSMSINILGLRAALTIVFLSPVAQIILSFMELMFRREKTTLRKRYKVLSTTMTVMTAIGLVLTFRSY